MFIGLECAKKGCVWKASKHQRFTWRQLAHRQEPPKHDVFFHNVQQDQDLSCYVRMMRCATSMDIYIYSFFCERFGATWIRHRYHALIHERAHGRWQHDGHSRRLHWCGSTGCVSVCVFFSAIIVAFLLWGKPHLCCNFNVIQWYALFYIQYRYRGEISRTIKRYGLLCWMLSALSWKAIRPKCERVSHVRVIIGQCGLHSQPAKKHETIRLEWQLQANWLDSSMVPATLGAKLIVAMLRFHHSAPIRCGLPRTWMCPYRWRQQMSIFCSIVLHRLLDNDMFFWRKSCIIALPSLEFK